MLINSLVGKQGIETTSLIEVIEFATLSCYSIVLLNTDAWKNIKLFISQFTLAILLQVSNGQPFIVGGITWILSDLKELMHL